MKKLTNFWQGVSQVLNIFGKREPYKYFYKSDSDALADDWRKVGEDFNKVMEL